MFVPTTRLMRVDSSRRQCIERLLVGTFHFTDTHHYIVNQIMNQYLKLNGTKLNKCMCSDRLLILSEL